MSSIGLSKVLFEVGKFAVYLTVPIALTYAVATDSIAIHKFLGFLPYIEYPPEGPPPPSPEELREMAREMAKEIARKKSNQ